MTNAEFLRGISIGLVAGATIGFAVAPKRKMKHHKNTTPGARALRAVGDVVGHVSDALGM